MTTAVTKTQALKRKDTQSAPSLEPPTKKTKRVCLDDVTTKFTIQELSVMKHDDIVARVIALQEHISTLTGSIEKKVKMSAQELDSKVEVVRKMMIIGLRSQMKALAPLSSDLADTCAVERISETRSSKINLFRSGP